MNPTWTKYHIPPQTGLGFTLLQGQLLRVIDPEGEQVADLVAFALGDSTEWLSNGRTFNYNETLYMTQGHVLYSNKSRPMFTILEDSVGRHDFLYTPCSLETFRIRYGVQGYHPNCLDNLTQALAPYGIEQHRIPTPFNVFMNVEVLEGGRLKILPPLSRPGDSILLRAEIDLAVGVSACSAGMANNYRCTAIGLEIAPAVVE